MQIFSTDQPTEIPGVFGYDDPILRNGIAENHMVRIATPPDIAGMDSDMAPCFVEPRGNLWRDAFINEEPHHSVLDGGTRGP